MIVFNPCKRRPLREPSTMVDLMYQLSSSTMITKRKEERGSPFHTPCEGDKDQEGTPLTMTYKNDKVVGFIIQLTHYSPKPKERRRALMYFQLSLSKDFERSNLISIPDEQDDLNEWLTSWDKMKLSII
jgi:hypothetical protein